VDVLHLRLPSGPRDAGSIVVGWLLKVVLAIVLVGISAFDAISVGTAHLNATDDASTAAIAAADEWHASHNVQAALASAQKALTNPNDVVVPDSLSIANDGSVQLRVTRKATTLIMYRIGPLKKYTFVTVSGAAPPSTVSS